MEDKICSVCRRQFSRRKNLTRHRKPLNNTGALSCPVCKRPVPASRMDSLVRHLRNRHCYSSDEAKKLVRSIGKNNVTKQSVCFSTTAPFMHCTYSSSLSLLLLLSILLLLPPLLLQQSFLMLFQLYFLPLQLSPRLQMSTALFLLLPLLILPPRLQLCLLQFLYMQQH